MIYLVLVLAVAAASGVAWCASRIRGLSDDLTALRIDVSELIEQCPGVPASKKTMQVSVEEGEGALSVERLLYRAGA